MTERTQDRPDTDELAIAALRSDYAHLYDAGRWDEFVDLFTDDAVARFTTVPEPVVGKEAISAFFRENDAFEYSFHTALMPRLSVDGDAATGEWKMCVFYRLPDGSSGWALGRYEDEYRRTDEGWKFSDVTAETHVDTGGGLLGD